MTGKSRKYLEGTVRLGGAYSGQQRLDVALNHGGQVSITNPMDLKQNALLISAEDWLRVADAIKSLEVKQ